MELAFFWLPIIGAILIGLAGLDVWFGGGKTPALWVGFAGVILLLLTFTLQLQQAIWQSQASEQPTQQKGDIAPASTQPMRGANTRGSQQI